MDVGLFWDGTTGDLVVSGNDLMSDTGLATAVIISLCSDGRATFSDELPTGETSRRGWWASDSRGWGSKLWLLNREKTLQQTAFRAEQFCREALQWLIDDGIASAVTVAAEILNSSTISAEVKISRGSNKKYDYLWRGMADNDAGSYVTRVSIRTGALA